MTEDNPISYKLNKAQLLEKMKANSGVYLSEVTPELLDEAGLWACVALLPKDFRERLQHLGNMIVQMGFNRWTKNLELKWELTKIATSLSYLLNSTSFEMDEYKEFDRREIDRKLGRERGE